MSQPTNPRLPESTGNLGFGRAAGTYSIHATVQLEVARHLAALIEPGAPSRVCELGAGTGLFTEQILARVPAAHVTAVDSSSEMLNQASARLPEHRVRLLCREAAAAYIGEKFDVVASSSALHWMEPLEDTFHVARRLLLPGGVFAASLMLEGTLGELHSLKARLTGERPSVFSTSAQIRTRLSAAGFLLDYFEEERKQAVFPTPAVLLDVLRKTGVNGGVFRAQRKLSRSELRTLVSAYAEEFKAPGGGVTAQFVVGYFIARPAE